MKPRCSRAYRIHDNPHSDRNAAGLAVASGLGCDSVLVGAAVPEFEYAGYAGFDPPMLGEFSRRCRKHRMQVLLELRCDRLAAQLPIVASHPSWFRAVADVTNGPIDPRRPVAPNAVLARLEFDAACRGVADWYIEQMCAAIDCGCAGFVVHWPQRLPPEFTRRLFAGVRRHAADAVLVAWTPGTNAVQRRGLRGCGYDAGVCSLPWWDYRAPWFADELDDLRHIGLVIAPLRMPGGDDERARRALRRAIEFARACADGIVFDLADAAATTPWPSSPVAPVAKRTRPDARTAHVLRPVGAPWAHAGAWLDAATTELVLVNSDLDHHTAVADAVADYAGLGTLAMPATLAPGEVRRITIPAALPMKLASAPLPSRQARAAARVAIERIEPAVDGGRFAAKCTLGETVVVSADVFSDGHPTLAVHLLWREDDRETWNRVRMKALGNDRWSAQFRATRLGRYVFTVEGGIDEFASFRTDLAKKHTAGQAGALDVAEGRALIEKAVRRAPEPLRRQLRGLVHDIAAAPDPVAALLAPECADLLNQALPPAFVTQDAVHTVVVERRAARCAAWYELFPRSQGRGGRHGTFTDVIAQLPRIAAMGFDVLYFPPIHPIGVSNRKGANNALQAQPGEPGSTYAIGGAEGGHDAVHPQLGTLADFRKLVATAAEHGLEIALDFAVQCSPDHPWIKQHPEWFDWRPDGSLKHAENPTKKYEDIVNVDFYGKDDAAGLWRALLGILAFWLKQGVRIFRVDNPHTKPLPFWEWLIAEMRALDPGVVFLSEAFTRPKPMYRLAKLGFSQSYTYFTWRNTRAELEAYLRELNAEPVRWFFRPHFFVNTPDINPYFLQTSGRAGFLIRAALAATLSGLWGMYSGFELCEAAPLPGREEYLDSEKYQLRERDWNAPGNIAAEIAELNRIRRANPALQTHLGVTFYNCSNDAILYFAKATPARDNTILVAICLDPHRAQEATIELPLWEWGLDDHGALQAEDLLRGDAFVWRGKIQPLRLDPAVAPYRLWRLRREEAIG